MRWKALAKRTFLEEHDSFPGMEYGEPPAANQEDTIQLDMHGDRAGTAGLTAFYRTLGSDDVALADGRPVGVLWAEKTFRFDNTDLVVLISPLPGGRALNGTGFIAVSTLGGNVYIPVKPVAGKNAFTFDFTTIPTDVEADRSRTVAHELGHSFGLGDEYADFDRAFPNPHADASDANLETEADAQIPDPNNPANHILSGDQISWIWHRIVAAAVVNGDITATGLDTFRIPVIPDVSFRFSQGDTLILAPAHLGPASAKVRSDGNIRRPDHYRPAGKRCHPRPVDDHCYLGAEVSVRQPDLHAEAGARLGLVSRLSLRRDGGQERQGRHHHQPDAAHRSTVCPRPERYADSDP